MADATFVGGYNRGFNNTADLHLSMIRFRLKELVADKEFKEARRITLEEIAQVTGVHRTTLSRLANQKGYNTTTLVIDKLCDYFEVDVGDLAQHIKKENK